MSDLLYWLTLTTLMTALLWVLYTVERILRVGLISAVGYAKTSGTAGFSQPDETPPRWAARAQSAHQNGVENLVIFAALALGAQADGIAEAVAAAAMVYFFDRLAYFLCYLVGIPLLRTVAFFAGPGAQLSIAFALLGAA